jgi:hypothetical protein
LDESERSASRTANDEPIRSREQDRLGRSGFAESIANEIFHADSSNGFVFGILGPWGSGKTSVLNLVKEVLNDHSSVEVVEFNPWLFSGTDQLIHNFFSELSNQLESRTDKLCKIADKLNRYGKALQTARTVPILGIPLGVIGDSARLAADHHDPFSGGVSKARLQISEDLRELKKTVVVFLDDLDRLSDDELREIIKLVRLTGSFPNIVYVLAFDRQRVEQALSSTGTVGREYLEKIIQITHDLPRIPRASLESELLAALDQLNSDLSVDAEINRERWARVLYDIIMPLIRNVRDIKRYCGSLRMTLGALAHEVALEDLYAIEAVRIFEPDVFADVADHADALTLRITGLDLFNDRRDAFKKDIEDLLNVRARQPAITRTVIRLLFPAADSLFGETSVPRAEEATWLRNRRLAHHDVLSLYLERVFGQEIAGDAAARAAVVRMNERLDFEDFFRQVNPNDRKEMIRALIPYVESLPIDQIEQVMVSMINHIEDTPDSVTSILDPNLYEVTRELLRDWLARFPSPSEIERASVAIMNGIQRLSYRVFLFESLISEDSPYALGLNPNVLEGLEGELKSELAAISANELASEPETWRLCHWMQQNGLNRLLAALTGESLELRVRLIRQSLRSLNYQDLKGRNTKSESTVAWNGLLTLIGGSDQLAKTLEEISGSNTDRLEPGEIMLLTECLNNAPKFPNI